MKTLRLEAPRDFRRVETAEPTRPGPGEALVRVHRVGICGTDISGYLGKMPFFSYPRIPGHGGMRPQFLLPARKLHPSKSLGFDQLALVETLAIGCHAVDRGAPVPD